MALSTLRQQSSEKKSFSWKIPHFVDMRNSKEVVDAQECTFEMGGEIGLPCKWKAFLQMKENADIGVYFTLMDYPKQLTEVHATVRIRVKAWNWKFTKNMVNHTSEYGFTKVIEKKDKDEDLTENGVLQVVVTITLFNLGNSALPSLLAEHEGRFMARLQVDLASIRGNPPDITNHRVTIVSKDGKEFGVDPYILAARSPVFRSMFESKMSEAETGTVKVDDIGSESLDVLLEFCHSAALKENWKEVGVIEDLLYGAGKYMLEDLKIFLGKAVALVCTKENCAKLFSLSQALGMKEAEASLLDYFKRNMVNDVKQIVAFVQDLDLSAIPEESVSASGESEGESESDSEEEEESPNPSNVH